MYIELRELIGGKGSRENIANEIANNNSTNEKKMMRKLVGVCNFQLQVTYCGFVWT